MEDIFTRCLRKVISEYKNSYSNNYHELTKNLFRLFGNVNKGIVNKMYEVISSINPKNIFYDSQNQTIRIVNEGELEKIITIWLNEKQQMFTVRFEKESYINDEVAMNEDDPQLKNKLKNKTTINYEYNSAFPNELLLLYFDSENQKINSYSKIIYSFRENGTLEKIEEEIDENYNINIKIDCYRIAREYYYLKKSQLLSNTKEDIEKNEKLNKSIENGDLSFEQLFLDEDGIYSPELVDEFLQKIRYYGDLLSYYDNEINNCLLVEQQLHEKRISNNELCFKMTTFDENGKNQIQTIKTTKNYK